jgi:hypothetical protein
MHKGKGMAKKYSVNMEGDKVLSVEIDGKKYSRAEQIPNQEDRERVEDLLFGLPDEEIGSAAASSPGMLRMIPVLFLSIAVLMMGISIFSAIVNGRATAKEKSTPGHVLDFVIRTDSDGNEFYYPVVQFILPDKGRQVVQLSEGSWPPAYQKGEPVIILYNPDQPSDARIKSNSSTVLRWTVAFITGVLGLAFLGATFFARWVIKS